MKALVRRNELAADDCSPSSPHARAFRLRVNQPQRPKQFGHRLTGPDDRTLLFESRFESGNLYLAQKVSDHEYNLLMQNDINTQGHTQWFYFRTMNTRKGQTVKFNILNYSKPDSLFNYGMKVSMYSDKKAEHEQIGWFKGGKNIGYT